MDRIDGVPKRSHKTPLLTSLKQCVKKIENEVSDLKHSFSAISLDSEENENKALFYFEKSHSIKKEVSSLQHDSQKLKTLLNAKVGRTKSYFYDMEDLTLDIEDEIGILERHLKNHGYEPLELDTSSIHETELVADSSYSENEIAENDVSLTPQFDIPSVSFPQKKEEQPIKEVVEVEPSTPELKIQEPKPERKPRHVLPSPLPYPNIGSASRLGDVARRLDF
ncbi:hypothetical protein HNY73_011360 [Argiope bruennichi]|uniref:Uncharacterized protein n=1 Tax=Argiope bruennichi TaxID=94029 RepID=A0A8T0F8Z4_ARGBR|nr:hypothetical protein HNY73_011360 [Argiope bruennichi]